MIGDCGPNRTSLHHANGGFFTTSAGSEFDNTMVVRLSFMLLLKAPEFKERPENENNGHKYDRDSETMPD